MSTTKRTGHPEKTTKPLIATEIGKLSLNKTIQTKIDQYLFEAAFYCIEQIAIELSNSYRQIEKLNVIPKSLSLEKPIRAKAAEYFIQHNQTLNKKYLIYMI